MIEAALRKWLDNGRNCIGEIAIRESANRFELTHREDVSATNLQQFDRPQDALEIARLEETGNYRPLKTAPNLRRGWRLSLNDLAGVALALDFFYPAMLGTFLAHERQNLAVVDFRATADRQSGMYAIVKKITTPDIDNLIGGFCKSCGGCLKTILWKIDSETPITTLPSEKFDPRVDQFQKAQKVIPMLCAEPCNLLIAAAREVVKKPSV